MKKWLISYRLYVNDNFGTSLTSTTIIDTPPEQWWKDKVYREKHPEDDWDGCTVLMIHEFEETRASEWDGP